MGVLLYYPTVNPPTEVVHQALLYWDGIASVVPRDPRVYEALVGTELRRLEERELYRPLAFTSETLRVLSVYGPAYGRTGPSSPVNSDGSRPARIRPSPPRRPKRSSTRRRSLLSWSSCCFSWDWPPTL
jgi:hypothetical protein